VVGRPLREEELVERAKSGDAEAYGELVQAYQGIAFRTAYLITGSEADAEEAAQDGFVKAFYAFGRFRSGEPLRPWLLQIVANEARNRRRSAGRRARLALRAAEERTSGGAAPSPEDSLLSDERRAALLEAVNGLREEERLVVSCRYFLELSEEETAQALGLRRGTVKSRLSRGLTHLREAIGDA
jgi:RNA polymerase sigma factor (sigma-70 family)